MGDFNRQFNKPTILDITEAQANDTEGWDGNLQSDQPTFTLKYIRLSDGGQQVRLRVEFTEQQGQLTKKHSRVYYLDTATAHPAARAQFLNLYNWCTDNIIKVIPDLNDGVEQ